MSVLRSRDNPRVKRWMKLVQDSRFRKKEACCLIEGPHLVAALLERGLRPLTMLATEAGLERAEIRSLVRKSAVDTVVLSESVFRAIVDAETPQGIAAEIAIPQISEKGSRHTVFLEGVQDPSNVGAIIRSAAAFGVGTIVLDRACADPWSPKALRAGMGGHFHVNISIDDLFARMEQFRGKLICTVPRSGVNLRETDLSGELGWIFGAEGQGVSPRLQEKAELRVTIPTSPATESLNIAAAVAICLYAALE